MHLAWGAEERRSAPSCSRSSTSTRRPRRASGATSRAASRARRRRTLIPQWARDWQATLFDHGWMIPGYPPELGGRNATPIQTLVYLEEMADARHPALAALPRVRDRRAEPARVRHRRAEGARAGRDPRRHDLVHRHERAERGLGPRRAADPRRARRRPLRRQRPEGLDVVRDGCRRSAAATCAPIPTRRSTRASRCSSSTWTRPGIEIRPLRHITGAADFAEVFFTDVEVPRENLVGELNDGWRITQGSLAHERAGLWVEGVARLEQTITGLDRPRAPARRRRRPDRAPAHRRGATQRAASLRALGYKGFTSFAQGSSRARALLHEDGDARSSARRCYELGMEIQGAYGAVDRRGARRGARAAGCSASS